MITFLHQPVLLQEVLDGLKLDHGGVYVDGTVGGAGHSLEIAKRLTTGRLYGFDQDPDAIQAASERLFDYPQVTLIHANFCNLQTELLDRGVQAVDGVLLDLGVSSYQLDTPERGFSYRSDTPLDMRMSKTGISAKEIVNGYSLEELSRVIRDYGEERYHYNIAKNIVKQREFGSIETTGELSEIIRHSMPMKARRDKNPSKRTFQALRIAVNQELDVLPQGLAQAFSMLKPGGRLAVITFHSLEDRIVKNYFTSLCRGCTCPPDFPVCVCGNKPKAVWAPKKPVLPTEQELQRNRRSQSAKLRIVEKCKE